MSTRATLSNATPSVLWSMISSICRATIARSFNTTSRRLSSGSVASWSQKVSNPANKYQIYVSKSSDPYINLSIEHYFFQKSPPGSKFLFLYVNRPCIVIGRNQNPWLEVNLALLRSKDAGFRGPNEPDALGNIDLVRRRSGGGTVFHDEGNVNWSVICDFTEFTRDKHAEMVVRALRSIGVDRARVNERHDIVLDQGSGDQETDPGDTHRTAFTDTKKRPLKVSGSAYKMARNRALHHGTALLRSPNLSIIPDYLHSPAKLHISAKGVESVSSPVSNIGVGNSDFVDTVIRHFTKTYRITDQVQELIVGDDALEVPEIRSGHSELTSLDWTYLQTPQFTFSSEPLQQDHMVTSEKPRLTMDVRHGVIVDCNWSLPGEMNPDEAATAKLQQAINGKKIHATRNWLPLLQGRVVPSTQAQDMAALLEQMLPYPQRQA